ncbi:hypothetical protein POM88_036244 [Heracleum sosnowskyi]|uniref:Cytochrome P450 n=1 Tax=Heracleum sosnowskyi TaxID=360622 RepID=A0AAD8HPU2_9APIA|nr:hypothetical protein POM88_036244 [Heracleum sosnowskyi]
MSLIQFATLLVVIGALGWFIHLCRTMFSMNPQHKPAPLVPETHDTVFASRPKLQAAEYLWYGTKGMIFSEYGTYWRNLRKFCTLELLSSTKIASMAKMRREELVLLVESLNIAAKNCEVVFIPFLGALDPQGLTRRLKETNRAVDEVLETISDEHEQDARDGCKKLDRDFVDVLIYLNNNPSTELG